MFCLVWGGVWGCRLREFTLLTVLYGDSGLEILHYSATALFYTTCRHCIMRRQMDDGEHVFGKFTLPNVLEIEISMSCVGM